MRSSFNSNYPFSHSYISNSGGTHYGSTAYGSSSTPSRSLSLTRTASSSRFDYGPSATGGGSRERGGSPFSREFARNNNSLFAPSPPMGRRSSANDTSQLVRQKRVTRDDATSNLLEMYGVRKTSNTEGPAASYLKARKQSQQQQQQTFASQHQSAFDADSVGISFGGGGRAYGNENKRASLTNNETRNFGVGSGLFDTSASASASRYGGGGGGQTMGDPCNITQEEYMQRLLAAHSRVDELLRSRGLTAEDEKNYLRAWEEIPIIREERRRRLRTPSVSSSDSGLSTDNDSDRSGADKVQQEAEQIEEKDEEEPEEIEEKELPEDTIGLLQELRKKEKRAKCGMIIHLEEEYESVSFSCKAASIIEISTDINISTKQPKQRQQQRQKPQLLRQMAMASSSIDVPMKGLKRESSELKCRETKFQEKSCVKTIEKKVQSVEVVNHNVNLKNKGEAIAVSVKEPETIEVRRNLVLRKRAKEESTLEQQKELLANLKPRKEPTPPSSAEISIQHCSFYQVTANHPAARNKAVEQNVRMNLRLTERALKDCTATISLPSPPRTAYVRLDVPLVDLDAELYPEYHKLKMAKRSNTIQCKQAPKIGKLDRSKTLCLNQPEFEKELRKVNRLQIPEYFLQSSARALEDFKSIRDNLKKAPLIVGGFVVVPKQKETTNPQSQLLHRVNAIRRRGPPDHLKSHQEPPPSPRPPYSDFILSQPIPEVRIHEPKEPLPLRKIKEPPDRCRSLSPHRLSPTSLLPLSTLASTNSFSSTTLSSNVAPPPSAAARRAARTATAGKPHKVASYLNLPGSLERTATSRGAAKSKKTINIAELSETDRILIEQYRRTLNIPKPQFKINPLSPYLHKLRILIPKPLRNAPPPQPRATWVKKKEPKRFAPPPKELPPESPKLLPANINKKFISKCRWFEIPFTLKKVDWKKHAARKMPKIRKHRWMPRWRKKCTDEEVEEEEVEEEDAEQETQAIDDDEASERGDEVKSTRGKKISINDEDGNDPEGVKAMLAAKRRAEEEAAAKLMSYEETRKLEREKEEEEMRKLKEKKERRRLEREQEEKEMEEKRREAEERRKMEEEERKAKQEMERRKKEEEKNKRANLTGAAFPGSGGGRSFTIEKKSRDAKDEKFGNIVQAKQEMGMTKEQQEEAKRAYMNAIQKGIPEVGEVAAAELKNKIKELHQRIVKVEGQKYDLEKRHERQEYDMKELNERQRQVTRNSALRKGIDPTEAGNSRYPPKVQIVSKYDRQIDRRNFKERRSMFENKHAHPQFPGVPPPPALYEKVIKKLPCEMQDEEAVGEDEE